MHHWRSRAGVGVAATALASLLVASLAAPTLALTVTNANPSVTVPTGTPTNVGISYIWNGTAPADTLAASTTLAVTLPSAYGWTVVPTLAASAGSMTLSGPVATTVGGNVVETWTVATFTATGAWTLTLSGGQVSTTSTSGSSSVMLSVAGGSGVQIAVLTASGATSGTIVPVTVSPLSVPADGASTINVAFGAVSATCTADTSFTVATTGGTLTTTSLPGVTSPVNGTSVTVLCANFASVGGKTLTLQAPTTPGTATITLTVTPASGPAVTDSTTTVTFTKVAAGGGQGGNGNEHSKGARKVAFFSTTGTTACASAPATPSAGSKSLGFAILNTTGHNRLNVTVSLKGALPNATYSVSVQQSPGGCSTPFTIHTNARGNGNGHVHLALTKGATQAWVTATSGSSVLVTRVASLPMKGHDANPHAGNQDNQGQNQGDNPGHGHGKP